jgi:hypothetical protein
MQEYPDLINFGFTLLSFHRPLLEAVQKYLEIIVHFFGTVNFLTDPLNPPKGDFFLPFGEVRRGLVIKIESINSYTNTFGGSC